jgi:hypothetical protein
MKGLTLLVMVGVGCSAPAPTTSSVANANPIRADGPCDLVEAMLSIENPHYQDFYKGKCSSRGPTQPVVVDVQAPSLVPADSRCDGRAFRLYRGEPIDEPIVRLSLKPDGALWRFTATMFQPALKPNPEGGFDSIDSYCAVKGGFVELRDGAWRTFYDFKRGTTPR